MISTGRNDRRRSVEFISIIKSRKYLIRLSSALTAFILLSLLITYSASFNKNSVRISLDFNRVITRDYDRLQSTLPINKLRFNPEHHQKSQFDHSNSNKPTILVSFTALAALSRLTHSFRFSHR